MPCVDILAWQRVRTNQVMAQTAVLPLPAASTLATEGPAMRAHPVIQNIRLFPEQTQSKCSFAHEKRRYVRQT